VEVPSFVSYDVENVCLRLVNSESEWESDYSRILSHRTLHKVSNRSKKSNTIGIMEEMHPLDLIQSCGMIYIII